MDELRDLIARALTDHRYLYAKKSMGGIREEFCTCGWSTGPKSAAWVDFARHQADVVIEALGMRAETTAEATERIARQIAATSAMTGRDALEIVEAVQALQNAETTTDLHWSNAAAAEYPGDEYEQYPLRTAFGRGVKWERKRAARKALKELNEEED